MSNQWESRLTASDVPDDVERVVRAYERALPGRVLAYYLTGSRHDRTAIPASDIDLILVFRPDMSDDDLQTSAAIIRTCKATSRLRLDLALHCVTDFAVGTDGARLKLGSTFVYGKDIRADLVLPPIDVYRRAATWSPYRFLVRVLRGADVLAYPLAYPEPEAPLYGYARVRLPEWYPAGFGPQGTKELVSAVTWTATAWLALAKGRQTGSAQQAVEVFTAVMTSEWTAYVDAVYRLCKGEWHYQVPAHAAAVERLAELCRQMLAFENAYLAVYRTYLLALLDGSTDDRRFAAERLGQVLYTDGQIVTALRTAQRHASDVVRQAASATLDRIPNAGSGAL